MENTELERFNSSIKSIILTKKARNKKHIAEIIGVSSSYFSRLCTGKEKISNKLLQKMHRHFGINEFYITDFKGDMYDEIQDTRSTDKEDFREEIIKLQKKIIELQQENSELKLENERLKSAFTSDATDLSAGRGCRAG